MKRGDTRKIYRYYFTEKRQYLDSIRQFKVTIFNTGVFPILKVLRKSFIRIWIKTGVTKEFLVTFT